MKVTLAYPIDDLGQPDETVEVDDERGRTLLRDGHARPADSDSTVALAHIPDMTIQEPPLSGAGSGRDAWAAYARQFDVTVSDDMTRDQIIEAVQAAGKE